ncbi:phage tail protein [Celerinatantimonas yamalensis]|uniref:Phage tail protein n=1 Tax=Celerinatantimonas yamalensis TaxID=559956 RepID=A0ABW9G264_9GAMM
MADDGSAQSETVWPMPKFHFEVKWDGGAGAGMVAAFQEISGLDTESQPIEYRAGNSPVFSTIKMPGIVKSSNITLKKGIFKSDNKFYEWYSKIKMNTIARTAVTINLLDEAGSPVMSWKLKNAWPTKVTGTDLKSDGNEVAVETIELVHEGLEIAV